MIVTARFTDSYRANSEDRAEVITTDAGIVLVVADGVGGQANGGAAADYAVSRIREAAYKQNIADPLAWYKTVQKLDSDLLENDDTGQTTLVVVAITARRIVGVSAGDSSAWLVTPSGHWDLTEGQKRKPFLGSGAEPVPFSLPLPDSGTIVAGTDGLFKYAPDVKIQDTALLLDPDDAVTRLADLARLTNGKLPDDIAILLCRFSIDRPSLGERVRSLLGR